MNSSKIENRILESRQNSLESDGIGIIRADNNLELTEIRLCILSNFLFQCSGNTDEMEFWGYANGGKTWRVKIEKCYS